MFKIWSTSSYQCKTRSSLDAMRKLRKFLDPQENPNVIRAEHSLECSLACENIHCASAPHRAEMRCIAERAVRETQKKAREQCSRCPDLMRSGRQLLWEWCCNFCKIQYLSSGGETPDKRRFGETKSGPFLPLGRKSRLIPI